MNNPNFYLVSRIETSINGGNTVRIGDLNGDGAPDILLVQSVHGTREITCLTAYTPGGDVIWQSGTPASENTEIYSDLPVQIHDWDGDGHNEIVLVRQANYAEIYEPAAWYRERASRYEGNATLAVLDAATGREKSSFAIPAAADDSILFADLTGRGRPQDLVVKDRYWNMWGVSYEGEVLWHWEGSTGHYPAVADIDGDGRDEVFVGYALLDHDGKPLWEHDAGNNHSDANTIVRLQDGDWRLLYGNGGVECLDVEGKRLWRHDLFEAQHVVAGNFRPDLSPVSFMVINRGHPRSADGGPATLYLYDMDGREIWNREQPPGSWAAIGTEIDWSGYGEPREFLISTRAPGQPCCIWNGAGEIVATFPPGTAPGRYGQYVQRADLWGDSRQEAILYDHEAICIYANALPHNKPTHFNCTHYNGM